jgi:lipid II:glycine glycyltransferase (peptidoglycan interpeptide bridge formation enzyme)
VTYELDHLPGTDGVEAAGDVPPESPPRSIDITAMPQQRAPGAACAAAGRVRGRRLLAELTVIVTADPDAELVAAWDELVTRTANSDVAQLSAWAAVRRLAGYEPLYVLAVSGATVLGGALLLRRRVRPIGWIGYLPYGPLLADGSATVQESVRHELVTALDRVARAHTALFVQPPDGGDQIALGLLQRGFRFSSAAIAPTATIRVDLNASAHELLSGLSRRLRTWTRQWPERGVTVRVGDERDIPILARLAASTADYQRFTPFPLSYLESAYRGLAAGGHVVLLIGELDGTPVAAELLTGSGGVLKSRITGFDRGSPGAAKLNVASAIIWEAICWAKANGYRYYDFGGLRPESMRMLQAAVPNEHLPGPDQFKTKFGGEVRSYPPAVEMLASPVVRLGYDVLRRGPWGKRLLDAARKALRAGAQGRQAVVGRPHQLSRRADERGCD